ncbi:RAI1 [Candida pseudojiufengensis]|uniref:RAI1 n=1 Tax=Candida pseudojiufengensis TaxID=497109 RepID=UPI002224F03A|nr:RAI1 [Candida pseudojiufengensis]KAI5963294.1 RAI1 [Candida pseudojiufengensis]
MNKSLPLTSRAKTTALKQPKELFTYTRNIDGQHQYNKDNIHNNLSYYYLPDSKIDTRIDLQSGFKNFKKIPMEDDINTYPALLDQIIEYEKQIQQKLETDIITFRGIMTRLMSIPYNLQDPIDLVIVPYDGQLFMNWNFEIEYKRRKEQEDRQRQTTTKEKYEYIKKCEYSGYKFETISTIPDIWSNISRKYIETRHKLPVNNYEQFLSVIKTGIGNVKLILAGEIDCCWDYIPDNTSNSLSHYVELKTTKIIENDYQVLNFEKKLFKTWCQCFLMGITKIIYGFRDDLFILRNVEIYNTEEIPILIKENPLNNLKQNQQTKINCTSALKWYGAVVEWINSSIDKLDESKSYGLSYDPIKKSFNLTQLKDEENSKLRNGGLLTEKFRTWREEEIKNL